MNPADSEAVDLSEVRFYVDENLAGLGLTLRKVRPFRDLVVGSHPPIQHLVPKDDPDWIPDVAGRGWVVITNDKHIRTRPFEAPRAIEVGLRCVHLDPPGAKNPRVWDFLRLVLRHWDHVEALCSRTGGDRDLPARNFGVTRYAGDDRVVNESVNRVLTVPKEYGIRAVQADIAARRPQDRARRARSEGARDTVLPHRPHDPHATGCHSTSQFASAQGAGDEGGQFIFVGVSMRTRRRSCAGPRRVQAVRLTRLLHHISPWPVGCHRGT